MNRAESGFALAETLIAVGIIAMMTMVTFEAVATDAKLEGAVRTRREAVLVAQSALAQAMAGGGADDGRSGRFVWQIARAPYQASGGSSALPLDRIAVRVSDADHAVLTLQTLRPAQ